MIFSQSESALTRFIEASLYTTITDNGWITRLNQFYLGAMVSRPDPKSQWTLNNRRCFAMRSAFAIYPHTKWSSLMDNSFEVADGLVAASLPRHNDPNHAESFFSLYVLWHDPSLHQVILLIRILNPDQFVCDGIIASHFCLFIKIHRFQRQCHGMLKQKWKKRQDEEVCMITGGQFGGWCTCHVYNASAEDTENGLKTTEKEEPNGCHSRLCIK